MEDNTSGLIKQVILVDTQTTVRSSRLMFSSLLASNEMSEIIVAK